MVDERAEFGTLYCKLSLRIDKHFPRYVDAYFGPKRLKAEVDNEPKRSISKLI